MLPSGDIVPATLVRNNKTGRVIPLVSVSPAPGPFSIIVSEITSAFFQEALVIAMKKIHWFEKRWTEQDIQRDKMKCDILFLSKYYCLLVSLEGVKFDIVMNKCDILTAKICPLFLSRMLTPLYDILISNIHDWNNDFQIISGVFEFMRN